MKNLRGAGFNPQVIFAAIFLLLFLPGLYAQKADRYAALTDLSADGGNLVLFALDLDVPADSPDKSGDCMILLDPDGQVMLIDAGHPASSGAIIKLLEDLGIKKIDSFIMTHPHIDHLGGFPAIAQKFPVGRVYRSHLEHESAPYANFTASCKNLSIPVTYLAEGDVFSFGKDTTIKVYNPPAEFVYPKDFPANSTEFINNNSLLLLFTFGKAKLLLGGDLYSPRENELVKKYAEELKADLAKMNHHGMGTSNTLSWIRAVKPAAVFAMNDVMSTMSVLNTYKKYGAKIFLALEDGLLKFSLNNRGAVTAHTQFDSWLRDF